LTAIKLTFVLRNFYEQILEGIIVKTTLFMKKKKKKKKQED